MVAYSFKQRFANPILYGLGLTPVGESDPLFKRQTIRADRKRHARPGEELQLYTGMRTKHCHLIGRARCISVDPIEIHVLAGRVIIRQTSIISGRALDDFARADGFKMWGEMREFWHVEHPGQHVFTGVLIKWEPTSCR